MCLVTLSWLRLFTAEVSLHAQMMGCHHAVQSLEASVTASLRGHAACWQQDRGQLHIFHQALAARPALQP